MHADLALQLLRDLLWTGLKVCGPLLALTMVVGLVISVIQVVTQIQEMSLTFVPKLLAACICVMVLGSWMLRTVTQFTTRLWVDIPRLF